MLYPRVIVALIFLSNKYPHSKYPTPSSFRIQKILVMLLPKMTLLAIVVEVLVILQNYILKLSVLLTLKILLPFPS